MHAPGKTLWSYPEAPTNLSMQMVPGLTYPVCLAVQLGAAEPS